MRGLADGKTMPQQPKTLACASPQGSTLRPVRLVIDRKSARIEHERAARAGRGACRDWNCTNYLETYAASQVEQDALLTQIFSAIGYRSRYFVEWGARRPNILNSAHFRVNCKWCGLLLDGAPGAS